VVFPCFSEKTAPDPVYVLPLVCSCSVAGSEVSAPEWFALRFDGGDVLRVSTTPHSTSRSRSSQTVSSCERSDA